MPSNLQLKTLIFSFKSHHVRVPFPPRQSFRSNDNGIQDIIGITDDEYHDKNDVGADQQPQVQQKKITFSFKEYYVCFSFDSLNEHLIQNWKGIIPDCIEPGLTQKENGEHDQQHSLLRESGAQQSDDESTLEVSHLHKNKYIDAGNQKEIKYKEIDYLNDENGLEIAHDVIPVIALPDFQTYSNLTTLQRLAVHLDHIITSLLNQADLHPQELYALTSLSQQVPVHSLLNLSYCNKLEYILFLMREEASETSPTEEVDIIRGQTWRVQERILREMMDYDELTKIQRAISMISS